MVTMLQPESWRFFEMDQIILEFPNYLKVYLKNLKDT